MDWLEELDDSVSVSASMLLDSKPYLSKPKQIGETYTATVQDKSAILELLKGYQRVDNIDDINLGSFVRYITLDKDNKQQFRLGGKITNIHPKYVKLEGSNNTSWFVKRYHYADGKDGVGTPIFKTLFFRKVSTTELMKKQLTYKIKIIEVLRTILNKHHIDAPSDMDIENIIRKIQETTEDDVDAETVLTHTTYDK
jgi:hypothetical protein